MAEKKALGGFSNMKKFIKACFAEGSTIETMPIVLDKTVYSFLQNYGIEVTSLLKKNIRKEYRGIVKRTPALDKGKYGDLEWQGYLNDKYNFNY